MEARRTDARVAAMVAAHGEALRRVARRYSASAIVPPRVRRRNADAIRFSIIA